MSKKLFTEQEIIILKQNKYIKKVSSKGITYTDEFKKIFINESINGKLPRIILTGQMHGPDLPKTMEVLGKETCLNRIKYVKNNVL